MPTVRPGKTEGETIMKKFDIFKTIQLVFFIIIAAVGLYVVLTDGELYQMIANDSHIRMLCILLWLALVVAFVFIFMDFSLFSTFKREYRELDFAVTSDPVAGIANRYCCDTIIEKYLDKPVPDNLGCIMFDLTNINEVNRLWGHIRGNELIYDFSSILQSSSANLCFVGRNGGNKFMALFENGSPQKMNTFLSRVDKKVKRYNTESKNALIEYAYGSAYGEGDQAETITDIIALSNRRIHEELPGDEE